MLPPAVQSLYGADDRGMIAGWHFPPGQPPQPLSEGAQALALLDAGAPGFVWLHMNLSHSAAGRWLRDRKLVTEDFFDALDAGSRSTRIERQGELLFAVMNDVTFDFDFEASDVATLWLQAGPRLVVTARRHPLRAVDRLRTAVKRGESLAGSAALLDHLLSDQADELQAIVRRAAERVDDIEDELLAGRAVRHTAELARLRRLMVRLQRLLAPEPSALLRTLANPPRWMAEGELASLRNASEEFALVLRDVGALQERVKLIQDESATRVAEDNNRSLFVLTMVTVLALPINLISGLFGMNVGGLPLADSPAGFWTVLALIAALTVGVVLLVLRRFGPKDR